MATQPSAEATPDTVLMVIQKGYRLHERLLRPARVIVARTPE
jgi:molecular chaperone GrpE